MAVLAAPSTMPLSIELPIAGSKSRRVVDMIDLLTEVPQEFFQGLTIGG